MKPRQPAAQRGVFAILFAVLLVVILALAGLAIDIAFVYERHGDMKNFANAAAVAAAHQLDGSADGVENAIDAAQDSVDRNSWAAEQSAGWDDAALTFGTSADGPWQSADYVLGLATEEIRLYRYARVDAGLLDLTMATITRYFPFNSEREVRLASVASVAGPVLAQMLPLAVCALSESRYAARPVSAGIDELVEHGFRRGVTYNLLNLNPEPGPARSFLVNPVDFPDSGSGVDAANFTHAAVAPFVCSGSITQPGTDKVYVQEPFPTSLIPELNSRFGKASTCVATAALPDRNIKEFFNPQPDWLKYPPKSPHAQPGEVPTRVTVADVDYNAPSAPDEPRAEDYGTLWAYARPVRYKATAADHVGTTFKKADFPKLYPVDPADVGIFENKWSDLSTNLPYMSAGAATYQPPAGSSLRYRRVLHVPLLECPVTSSVAKVLAVGKFMLTVPANDDPSNTYISAEFGGLDPGIGRSAETRLYQ